VVVVVVVVVSSTSELYFVLQCRWKRDRLSGGSMSHVEGSPLRALASNSGGEGGGEHVAINQS